MNLRKYIILIPAAASLIALHLCSLYSYLLFHSLVEMYIISVALGTFIITWNTRQMMDNGYLLFMGISYLFIGSVQILHTLAYRGMGVFPEYGANLSAQLWILVGYMEGTAFIGASFFIKRRLNPLHLFLAGITVTAFFLTVIFLKRFPDCFIEGKGLTVFKKSSEIGISLILAIAGALLYRKRNFFEISVLKTVLLGIGFNIGARVMFIFYISVYGLSNQIGHYFQLASFYCIYQAIIATGLIRPNLLLFREIELQKQELQKAHDELEHRIEKRTHELVQANEQMTAEMSERNKIEELLAQRHSEIKEINRELESFAYIVSHDLREPLRGIHNFSGLLLESYSGKFDGDGQYMLEHLSLLSKRMEEQISAVLNYSRLGREGLVFRQMNLNDAVQNVLYSLEFMIKEHGAEIRIPELLPCVLCDPVRIQEVFRNLIANALKYSDKPQPRIEIGWKDPKQNREPIPAFPPECRDMIVCYVRDNGIGIKAQHYEKIFQIFQRLHSQKKYGGGTGVGLTISKKIIERHFGKLWVQSSPGEGSTFYFTLLRGEHELSDSDHRGQ